MNGETSYEIKNIIKFAGAYVVCTIGSGFATGQEIMQFFTGYGMVSMLDILIYTSIFLLLSKKLFSANILG